MGVFGTMILYSTFFLIHQPLNCILLLDFSCLPRHYEQETLPPP